VAIINLLCGPTAPAPAAFQEAPIFPIFALTTTFGAMPPKFAMKREASSNGRSVLKPPLML
jgi:hypothetical protein